MQRSIPFLAVLLLAATLLTQACKSSEALPSTQVRLGKTQSARLGSGVTVRVDSILDSRCPQGVQCIIAGYASAALRVSTDADTRSLTLFLGYRLANNPAMTDSTVVSLGGQRYSVLLRDITPYPVYGKPTADKQALVEVKAL
ncbi:hypothetical protein GCM10027578_04120 [Spirosoma luteolum]